jgi:putative redox protein
MDIDGDNTTAPGPMLVLLLAMAGCTGSDIVHVLEKMRVELTDLSIEVEGVRRDDDPRRYDAVHLKYRISGRGLDDSKAERAVSLSVEKYCSVMHTLASDIAVSYAVEIGDPAAR